MSEWATFDGNGRVVHGDAAQVLREIPDASISLVATDPPYHRVKQIERDRQWKTDADYLAWLGGILDEFRRILKPNGSLYLFASPQMAARVECLVGERFSVLNSITWAKPGQSFAEKYGPENFRGFVPMSERIIFAEQYGSDSVADDSAGYGSACHELHKQVYAPVVGRAVQSKRLAAGLQRHEIDTACSPSKKPTGLCYRWEEGACLPTIDQFVALCRVTGDAREYEDLRREYEDLRRPFAVTADDAYTDVWQFPTVNTYPGKHECEKPADLMRQIVRTSSRPGDTVLDCFAGSGVTGQVALELGRKVILVERDEHWYQQSIRRVQGLRPERPKKDKPLPLFDSLEVSP